MGTKISRVIICTPGDISCVGFDKYKCNIDGTAWNLIERNSTYCGYTPGIAPNEFQNLVATYA